MLFWRHTSFDVLKVEVFCLYICHNFVSFFKLLRQNMLYEAENMHAFSHENTFRYTMF